MRRLCVAYRQLCAVTFAAIGLLCAACSGGPGGAVASSNNDRAPGNGDRPPSGTSAADAAPTSADNDQAPISSETPPGTSDASAGNGSLGALCEEFCTSLKNFSASCGGGAEEDDLCSCKVPNGYPCGPEAAAVFRCLTDTLDGLSCTGAGSGSGAGNGDVPGNGNGNGNAANPPQPTDGVVDFCKTELDRATACGKAHGIDDSSDGDTTQQHGCFQQGGCECDDPCQACTCKAAGNTDKITACYMAGGDCAVTR
jgi:hypothetical protein